MNKDKWRMEEGNRRPEIENRRLEGKFLTRFPVTGLPYPVFINHWRNHA